MFPNAKISAKRLDEYPIKVAIYLIQDDGTERMLFETHQRNLFRKYGAKRAESIAQIQAILRELIK